MAGKKVKAKTKKSKKYSINDGKINRAGKFCSKCGPGIFMAEHKDRNSCGKCGYTEKK